MIGKFINCIKKDYVKNLTNSRLFCKVVSNMVYKRKYVADTIYYR